MRRATPSQYSRSGVCLDLCVTESEAERPGEHVPRLVVLVVDMKRRDPVVADLRLPLDDHEVVGRGSKNLSREILDIHCSEIIFSADWTSGIGSRLDVTLDARGGRYSIRAEWRRSRRLSRLRARAVRPGVRGRIELPVDRLPRAGCQPGVCDADRADACDPLRQARHGVL